MHTAAQNAGAVAELAAARTTAKYEALENRYLFQPIVVESLGPINCSAVSFLSGLGRRTAKVSPETREGIFRFQRLSYNLPVTDIHFVHATAATESSSSAGFWLGGQCPLAA